MFVFRITERLVTTSSVLGRKSEKRLVVGSALTNCQAVFHLKEENKDPVQNDEKAKESSRHELNVLGDDPLFSGRGSPAFMSPSEPAIALLRERYKESFAFVNGTEHRVHLFVIKVGLWSLAWTFVFNEIEETKKYAMLKAALDKTTDALSGKDPVFLKDLDTSIGNALERTRRMLEKHGMSS